MRNLPAGVVKASGKTAASSAWLLLMEFVIGETTIRLASNPEDVVFGGNTYTAANLSISSAQESSDGRISSWALVVTDVARLLTPTLESYDGAIGAAVTLTIVNSKLLAENYAELSRAFVVKAADIQGDQITIMLAGSNLLTLRCPRYRYLSKHCNWKAGTPECGQSDPCNRTYAGCVANENTARFGGFLALQPGTLRYA